MVRWRIPLAAATLLLSLVRYHVSGLAEVEVESASELRTALQEDNCCIHVTSHIAFSDVFESTWNGTINGTDYNSSLGQDREYVLPVVNFANRSTDSLTITGECNGYMTHLYGERCVLDAKSLGGLLVAVGSYSQIRLENIVFQGASVEGGGGGGVLLLGEGIQITGGATFADGSIWIRESLFTENQNAGSIFLITSHIAFTGNHDESSILGSFRNVEVTFVGSCPFGVDGHDLSGNKCLLDLKGFGPLMQISGPNAKLRFENFKVINGETLSWGGVMVVSGEAQAQFTNVHFEGNSAGNGGAIAAFTLAVVRFNHVMFVGNSALGSGGAIGVAASDVFLTDVVFQDNQGWQGGAMFVSEFSTIYLVRPAFSRNTASSSDEPTRSKNTILTSPKPPADEPEFKREGTGRPGISDLPFIAYVCLVALVLMLLLFGVVYKRTFLTPSKMPRMYQIPQTRKKRKQKSEDTATTRSLSLPGHFTANDLTTINEFNLRHPSRAPSALVPLNISTPDAMRTPTSPFTYFVNWALNRTGGSPGSSRNTRFDSSFQSTNPSGTPRFRDFPRRSFSHDTWKDRSAMLGWMESMESIDIPEIDSVRTPIRRIRSDNDMFATTTMNFLLQPPHPQGGSSQPATILRKMDDSHGTGIFDSNRSSSGQTSSKEVPPGRDILLSTGDFNFALQPPTEEHQLQTIVEAAEEAPQSQILDTLNFALNPPGMSQEDTKSAELSPTGSLNFALQPPTGNLARSDGKAKES
ncbi:hypothetical protein BSKO_03913 [Bryopsis sp. KO-2023]|nr:hypothetical protein BSKO_03913 [Bryopsis sp. KO-2023]